MGKIYQKKEIVVISILFLGVILTGGYKYVSSKITAATLLGKKVEAKKMEEVAQISEGSQRASLIAIAPAEPEDKTDATSSAIIETAKASTETVGGQEVKINPYLIHKNISTTYFWAGEEAGKDNKNISNLPSAWDEQWVKHFGGVDDPNKRNGYVVASFSPKENSFYFALPYNDFDENGDRKKDVNKVIPWASSKKWADSESICKNQWIKISKGGRTAYAQWQDVGPFGEDDSLYVFGGKAPKSKTNEEAGLDVSPAIRDFLGLNDIDRTDWQFVEASQVPDGPWKNTITTSQINWN